MKNPSDTQSPPAVTSISDFVSLDGLAEALGISKNVVQVWRRERQLPGIRVGKRTFFHLPSVAAWLKAQEGVLNASEDDEEASE